MALRSFRVKKQASSSAQFGFGPTDFESESSDAEDTFSSSDSSDDRNIFSRKGDKKSGGGGGGGKQRNLLRRYGIAHHHRVLEQRFLSYDSSEIEPRTVANSMLQRLHTENNNLRLEELKIAFFGWKKTKIQAEMQAKFSKYVVRKPHPLFGVLVGSSKTSASADTSGMSDALLNEHGIPLPPNRGLSLQQFSTRMLEFFALLEKQDQQLKDEKNKSLNNLLGAFGTPAKKKKKEEDENEDEDEGERQNVEVTPRKQQTPAAVTFLDSNDGLGKNSHPPTHDGGLREEEDLRDFLALNESSKYKGLESLFKAIDCGGSGEIHWNDFLAFLMQAAMLGRVGQRPTESKNYDLLTSHNSSMFQDLVQAHPIASKEQIIIAAKDIIIFGNTKDYPVKQVIPTPIVTLQGQLPQPLYRVVCIAFIEENGIVLSSCTDGCVRCFSTSSGKVKHMNTIKFDCIQTVLLYHAGKRKLFAGSRSGDLTSFDVTFSSRMSTGMRLEATKAIATQPHQDTISCLILLSTESSIVTGSYDKTICIHDIRKQQVVRRLVGHQSAIQNLAHNVEYNILISVSFDSSPMVWLVSLQSRPPFPLLDSKPHLATIVGIEMIPSHASCVTLDARGFMKVWDLRSFQCVQSVLVGSSSYQSSHTTSTAVEPSAAVAISFNVHNPHAHMSDFAAIFHTFEPPTPNVPCGVTQLYVFSRKSMLVLEYNLAQRAASTRKTADDESILSVVFNPHDEAFITASSSLVRIWDAQSCAIRDTFRFSGHTEDGGISSFALHSNGRQYYVGTRKGSVFAHNISTGALISVAMKLHDSAVNIMMCCVKNHRSADDSDDEQEGHLYEKRGNSPPGTKKLGLSSSATRPAHLTAAMGEILVSASFEKVIVTGTDISRPYPLSDTDHARCITFCEFSLSICITDMAGRICVFQSDIISSHQHKPSAILRYPYKKSQPEICYCCALGDLSMMACADDEGEIALFGLKYFVSPNSPIAVWKHLSDSKTTVPSISCMGFFSQKSILYVGDEAGYITLYDLHDLLKACRHNTSNAHQRRATILSAISSDGKFTPGASAEFPTAQQPLEQSPPLLRSASIFSNTSSGGILPSAMIVQAQQGVSPPISSLGTSQQPPENLGADSPSPSRNSPAAPASPPTGGPISQLHSLNALASPFSVMHTNAPLTTNKILASQASPSSQAVPKSRLCELSKKVTVVNRWKAHDDAVTSLTFRNDGLYMCLASSGADQCVHGWTLSGSIFLGSLDQFGSMAIQLKAVHLANDIKVFLSQRKERLQREQEQSSFWYLMTHAHENQKKGKQSAKDLIMSGGAKKPENMDPGDPFPSHFPKEYVEHLLTANKTNEESSDEAGRRKTSISSGGIEFLENSLQEQGSASFSPKHNEPQDTTISGGAGVGVIHVQIPSYVGTILSSALEGRISPSTEQQSLFHFGSTGGDDHPEEENNDGEENETDSMADYYSDQQMRKKSSAADALSHLENKNKMMMMMMKESNKKKKKKKRTVDEAQALARDITERSKKPPRLLDVRPSSALVTTHSSSLMDFVEYSSIVSGKLVSSSPRKRIATMEHPESELYRFGKNRLGWKNPTGVGMDLHPTLSFFSATFDGEERSPVLSDTMTSKGEGSTNAIVRSPSVILQRQLESILGPVPENGEGRFNPIQFPQQKEEEGIQISDYQYPPVAGKKLSSKKRSKKKPSDQLFLLEKGGKEQQDMGILVLHDQAEGEELQGGNSSTETGIFDDGNDDISSWHSSDGTHLSEISDEIERKAKRDYHNNKKELRLVLTKLPKTNGGLATKDTLVRGAAVGDVFRQVYKPPKQPDHYTFKNAAYFNSQPYDDDEKGDHNKGGGHLDCNKNSIKAAFQSKTTTPRRKGRSGTTTPSSTPRGGAPSQKIEEITEGKFLLETPTFQVSVTPLPPAEISRLRQEGEQRKPRLHEIMANQDAIQAAEYFHASAELAHSIHDILSLAKRNEKCWFMDQQQGDRMENECHDDEGSFPSAHSLSRKRVDELQTPPENREQHQSKINIRTTTSAKKGATQEDEEHSRRHQNTTETKNQCHHSKHHPQQALLTHKSIKRRDHSDDNVLATDWKMEMVTPDADQHGKLKGGSQHSLQQVLRSESAPLIETPHSGHPWEGNKNKKWSNISDEKKATNSGGSYMQSTSNTRTTLPNGSAYLLLRDSSVKGGSSNNSNSNYPSVGAMRNAMKNTPDGRLLQRSQELSRFVSSQSCLSKRAPPSGMALPSMHHPMPLRMGSAMNAKVRKEMLASKGKVVK